MTIGINKKERVNRKVKKSLERKDNINQIYKADEATRRAIDALYVRKSDHRKVVAFTAGIVLFVGLALGVYTGMNMTHASASATQNVVKVEVLGDSKSQSQPKQ